jgi:hypothetical protein
MAVSPDGEEALNKAIRRYDQHCPIIHQRRPPVAAARPGVHDSRR